MRAALVAILPVVAMAAPWSASGETILRARDVRSLHVLELAGNPLTLVVAGTADSGAVSVGSISTEIRGDSLYVLVEIGPVQPRLSPSFEFSVVVPPGIAHVRFGPDGDAIWPR